MASYKITLYHAQDIQVLFHSEQHTSLLDVLKQSKMQIEFHCRAGFCGVCRVRLRKGKVAYHNNPIACINKDEILPCSCQPLTDIDIDIK